MKRAAKFLIATFCVLLISATSIIFLTGCDDWKYDEEAPTTSNIQHIVDDPGYRPGENVPMPQLAQGQILNLRLIYEINEKDKNESEWYQVELAREDGRWRDYVKIEGLSRTSIRHWDDYPFYATSFNYQVENEAYGIDKLDGIYTLTITGSNGYNHTYRLNWSGGKWTNMAASRTFYVP